MKHECELCHQATHYEEMYYERFTDTYMCAHCKQDREYELDAILDHHTNKGNDHE